MRATRNTVDCPSSCALALAAIQTLVRSEEFLTTQGKCMSIGSRIHLLTLADREFKREAKAPAKAATRRNFKALNIRLSKFNSSWDRKRGSAARFMAILLREDSAALHQRVCIDERASKTYGATVEWFQAEARYLRKIAGL